LEGKSKGGFGVCWYFLFEGVGVENEKVREITTKITRSLKIGLVFKRAIE
jgi:hypothetical protein